MNIYGLAACVMTSWAVQNIPYIRFLTNTLYVTSFTNFHHPQIDMQQRTVAYGMIWNPVPGRTVRAAFWEGGGGGNFALI
jgi:hypothetical protein